MSTTILSQNAQKRTWQQNKWTNMAMKGKKKNNVSVQTDVIFSPLFNLGIELFNLIPAQQYYRIKHMPIQKVLIV